MLSRFRQVLWRGQSCLDYSARLALSPYSLHGTYFKQRIPEVWMNSSSFPTSCTMNVWCTSNTHTEVIPPLPALSKQAETRARSALGMSQELKSLFSQGHERGTSTRGDAGRVVTLTQTERCCTKCGWRIATLHTDVSERPARCDNLSTRNVAHQYC